MAAKVATRSKSTKVEDTGERWVVVNSNTGRRPYLGPGVDEATAIALAATMLEPSFATPITNIGSDGRYVAPEADASANETEESEAEAVAA